MRDCNDGQGCQKPVGFSCKNGFSSCSADGCWGRTDSDSLCSDGIDNECSGDGTGLAGFNDCQEKSCSDTGYCKCKDPSTGERDIVLGTSKECTEIDSEKYTGGTVYCGKENPFSDNPNADGDLSAGTPKWDTTGCEGETECEKNEGYVCTHQPCSELDMVSASYSCKDTAGKDKGDCCRPKNDCEEAGHICRPYSTETKSYCLESEQEIADSCIPPDDGVERRCCQEKETCTFTHPDTKKSKTVKVLQKPSRKEIQMFKVMAFLRIVKMKLLILNMDVMVAKLPRNNLEDGSAPLPYLIICASKRQQ